MKNGKQILVFLFCISPLVGTGQTLEEYFREAAENNPGLSAGYLEFEAALEQVEEAKSLPNTNISFGYFISPVETRVGPQQARFSLSQMFPWFGSLDAQGNAAALSAESAYQDFLQERNFLYYKVASAYYPIYELEKLLGIEQANLEILESYKSMANRQFANGRGAMVDVLRVDLQINDARTEIKLLEEKRRPLQTAFNRLLNRPDSMPVEVRDTLIAQAVVNNRDSILFGTHPQLEALRLKSRAAEARGLAIEKQSLPSFGVGIDYILVGKRSDLSPAESDNLADNGKNAFMPMVSMSIPIFNSRFNASKRKTEIMRQAYLKREEETVNELITQYEMVWFELERNRQYMELYINQISETRQALNLLFSAYSNEGNEFEELLRMQQLLLRYEKLHVSALTDYKVAEARLNFITAKSY